MAIPPIVMVDYQVIVQAGVPAHFGRVRNFAGTTQFPFGVAITPHQLMVDIWTDAHGQLPPGLQWNPLALNPAGVALRGVAVRLIEIGRVPGGTILYDDSMVGGQLFAAAFPVFHFGPANPRAILDLYLMLFYV